MDEESVFFIDKKLDTKIKTQVLKNKHTKKKFFKENNYSQIFKQYVNSGEIWASRNEENPFEEQSIETQYLILEVKNKFARFEYIKPSALKGMISSAPIELILAGKKIQNKTIHGKIQLPKIKDGIKNASNGNSGK